MLLLTVPDLTGISEGVSTTSVAVITALLTGNGCLEWKYWDQGFMIQVCQFSWSKLSILLRSNFKIELQHSVSLVIRFFFILWWFSGLCIFRRVAQLSAETSHWRYLHHYLPFTCTCIRFTPHSSVRVMSVMRFNLTVSNHLSNYSSCFLK